MAVTPSTRFQPSRYLIQLELNILSTSSQLSRAQHGPYVRLCPAQPDIRVNLAVNQYDDEHDDDDKQHRRIRCESSRLTHRFSTCVYHIPAEGRAARPP